MKTVKKQHKRKQVKPRNLLGQLAAMPDKLFKQDFRQQYGALCFRTGEDGAVEILLITSRDSGRWIIPKGWPMKKRAPHEAAALEAWQEAGVRGVVRKKAVGRYTYLKWLDNRDVAPCIVDLYQIEVTAVSEDFKEFGQRQLAWVRPDEAARRVRELELKSILVGFKPQGKRRA